MDAVRSASLLFLISPATARVRSLSWVPEFLDLFTCSRISSKISSSVRFSTDFKGIGFGSIF